MLNFVICSSTRAEVPLIDDVKSFARFAVVEKKIGIIPGSAFFTQDEAHKGNNSFRISFAKVSPDVAKDGVLRLADAFDSYSSNRR